MSLYFAVLATLLLSGSVSPSYIGNKLKRRRNDLRIIGGRPANIEDLPYMVSVLHFGQYLCGGSVLNTCTVLTSATCVENKDSEMLTIRTGSIYYNQSGQDYRVLYYKEHPKYSRGSFEYNVAILKIRRSIEFSRQVKPIPIACKRPDAGAILTVAGWGELQEEDPKQDELHYATVIMADKDACAAALQGICEMTDSMICTYRKGSGTCEGDNGGPAVYKNQVVGVISHRFRCDVVTIPDVYADTTYPSIREFILSYDEASCW